MPVDVELKKRITVDGKVYESLDQVPAELRPAIEKALALMPEAGVKTTIMVNGKPYASMDDVPAPLRLMLRGVAALAATQAGATTSAARQASPKAMPTAEALRPEPIVSPRTIVVALVLAALLFFLARLVF